jgi:hypothetical protein
VHGLALGVTCANVLGVVLLAVANTLLHLRVIFWQAFFSLSPSRDLPLLERLGALNKLEIHDEFRLHIVLPSKT